MADISGRKMPTLREIYAVEFENHLRSFAYEIAKGNTNKENPQ